MKHFLVKIAYNGANYHGYQRQNNAYTVQQAVEEAIENLTGEKVSIDGCSRTDAGVHAKEYFFSFDINSGIPPKGFIMGMNDRLPGDIAVLDCKETDKSFHARYKCIGKEYEYVVHNSEIKNPFYKDTAIRYKYSIDVELLEKAAQDYVGKHDFKAFCCADCDKENTERTIYYFHVRREGEFVIFTVAGDGFLYNMVRIMVGTLLNINEGKLGADSIKEIIKSKDRTRAGKTVEPQGLYLNRVFYDKGFEKSE